VADVALPSGTVTFLFTDVEGSTRLWEEHPDAMQAALARHDELVRDAIEAHRGQVVKTTGDGFHAAFATSLDAVSAALTAQRTLEAEAWEKTGPLRVRMGVHTGEAQHRDGDYYGTALNRAARLMSVGHGGQVLVSSTTEGLVRDQLPDGCELVSLGAHQLRDLGRAEALFQLVHPDLPRDFAALRTVDAFPGNLPAQASSFVGRERDLVRVADALAASPVITLTGVGGVGKTRLALQVAAEVLPRFRDGAWMCELAAVRDHAGVVDAVAAVFRVTARPGRSLEESLVAYLRDQELLVVLDNCEHVLRPAATLVAAIEGACPNVRVLATSREGLNIPGEQILVVPSLGLPEEGADVEAAGDCEAVRLFAERARAAKADFAVDATNGADVVAICTRLDGVPLAIELAAARIPTMNPSELARRLDRRFRLLSGGNRIAIERHQTLRATIDWSYDLLTEAEQRLLERLSVFAGGCTLGAVEAVCAGDLVEIDDVYELLANLVARSLVVVDTGRDTRYRLLETIRRYGEERLVERGDADELRARHCDHYTQFAGVVREQSYGPGQVEWGVRLARERDNLHAAMAFALATRDVERALALVCSLPFWVLQVDDLVFFDPEPVLVLPGATDHPGSAVALVDAARQAWRRGDDPVALALCEQALAAESRLGPAPDSHVEMLVVDVRGSVATDNGAQRTAADHWLDAASRARADDLTAMTAIYLGTAVLSLAWIDPVGARDVGAEGLALARESGAPHVIVTNLLGLALTLAPDDPDRSHTLLDEALELTVTLGYENPQELVTAVLVAARLAEWPTMLRAASRTLHDQLRSGSLGPLVLAGTLNLAARGLVEQRFEAAATLQGAASAQMRRIVPAFTASRESGVAAPPDLLAAFVNGVRHDATQLLVAALGEPRLRELRADGAAMDDDEAFTYARAHIEDHLRTIHEDVIDG
jgi:predicted ATPase/class 3 adenylate cyclase